MENLNDFIELCRSRLSAFGKDLDYEENSWNVSTAFNRKAQRAKIRIFFTSWSSRNSPIKTPMTEPFRSFAKAFIRYYFSLNPVTQFSARLAALRLLEAALLEQHSHACPTRITNETLYRAIEIAKMELSLTSVYRIGAELEFISTKLITHRFSSVQMDWRNPIRRPKSGGDRVGKEFDERREKMMPSTSALDAIAKAFRLASSPRETVITSVAAILCSAPDRINEVLLLKNECEVDRRTADGKHSEYGLRWFPAKGADPMIKWVIRSMADVVREAIGRLRTISEPARAVARWYEANPKRVFLPPHLEHLRGENQISMTELADILYEEGGSSGSARRWCRSNDIAISGPKKYQYVNFQDIETKVVGMLPIGFPLADRDLQLKFSEMLCTVLRNSLHNAKPTFRCAIEQVVQGQIHVGLCGHPENPMLSIFPGLNLYEDDGSYIRITSHQFRHYLNTLAQMGGLSQLDIARWSGRRNIHQNTVYDHESGEDIVNYVRKMTGDSQTASGPLARLRQSTLIQRDDFDRLVVPTAHTTEFGYCVHDFTMLPCQLHRDCINCDEQVCIKGDQTRERALRLQREEVKKLLAVAKSRQLDGYAGVERWIAHHELTLKRIEQICSILDDPAVSVGSVIQPSGVVPYSVLHQIDRESAQLDPWISLPQLNASEDFLESSF